MKYCIQFLFIVSCRIDMFHCMIKKCAISCTVAIHGSISRLSIARIQKTRFDSFICVKKQFCAIKFCFGCTFVIHNCSVFLETLYACAAFRMLENWPFA